MFLGIFFNKIVILIVALAILIFLLPEGLIERVPLAPEIRSAGQAGFAWTKIKFSQLYELGTNIFRALFRWAMIAGEFIKNTINTAYEASRTAIVGTLEDIYEIFDKVRRVKEIVDE